MIRSLTSLRGWLIVAVVIFHGTNNYVFAIFTSFAMSMFFMLSGFSLAGKYHFQELDTGGYLSFLKRRLLRIYPLHIILVLLFSLKFLYSQFFQGEDCDHWSSLLPQVLLVQSWIPIRRVYFSFNGVAWFLSSIMFCYLCFPVVVRWIRRAGIWRSLLALGGLLAVIMAASSFLSGPPKSWLVYIFPPMRLVDFGVGIAIRLVYDNCRQGKYARLRDISSARAVLAEIGLILAIGAFFTLQYVGVLDRFNSEPFTLSLCALLLLAVSLADGRRTMLQAVVNIAPATWLGHISYEIFMLQLVVLAVTVDLFRICNVQVAAPLWVLLYLIILVAVAFLWNSAQKWFLNHRKEGR